MPTTATAKRVLNRRQRLQKKTPKPLGGDSVASPKGNADEPSSSFLKRLQEADQDRDEDFSFDEADSDGDNDEGRESKGATEEKDINQTSGQEQGQDEENFEGGMNLDDFLKQFGEGGENEGDGVEETAKVIDSEHPALRPLDGLSPSANGDERGMILSQKLNSPPAKNPTAVKSSTSKEQSPMDGTTHDFMATPPSLKMQTEKLKTALSNEEKNAARVDALLKKLNMKHAAAEIAEESATKISYPVLQDSTSAVANNYKHPKKEVKFQKSEKLPLYDKYNTGIKDHEHLPPSDKERDANLLTSQIATLKADLKRRDDRLSRVVEHDTLVSNKCEALKREVAYLKQSLHEANLECQAQMSRADNALLNKKKKKKASKNVGKLETEIKELVESNDRLVEREGALLEAIDQLSRQNEDLMRQLKEAMEKESKYSQLIHALSQANGGQTGSHSNGSSKHSSPAKGMEGSKSSSHVGEGHGKKKGRRDRALTTGTAELNDGPGAGVNRSKGKLPKLQSGPSHRHNHTRVFHCFD